MAKSQSIADMGMKQTDTKKSENLWITSGLIGIEHRTPNSKIIFGKILYFIKSREFVVARNIKLLGRLKLLWFCSGFVLNYTRQWGMEGNISYLVP